MVRTAAALVLSATIGVACSPDSSGLGDGGTATPLDPSSTSTGPPAHDTTGSTGPVAPDDTGLTDTGDPPPTGDATTGDDPATGSSTSAVDTGDTEALPTEVEYCTVAGSPIPDNSPTGVVSSIEVDLLGGGTIVSLGVVLQATHTWVGDLRFVLRKDTAELIVIDRPEAPDGTTCNGDDIDVLLYDAAADPIADQCLDDGVGPPPALAGELQPEYPLDPVYAGMQMVGAWRLFVTDNNGMDTGTLDAWCLRITYR